MTRIVLAYSGGLDTSIAIPWLAEKYGAEIIAVTIDLGQGEDLEEVRDRALATGALRAHVLDVRDEFARYYIVRALKAGALCHDRSPMAAPLGRPLIAQTLVTIAHIEQATAVAHGDRGREAPIDLTVRALDPTLTIIAPAREWEMTWTQQVEYARQRNLALPASITGGDEGRPTVPRPAGSPDEPASVDIAIERGVPTAINGVAMPLLDLIGSLDILAGAHGVGRLQKDEFKVGPSSAMVALHAAHQELQKAAMPSDAEHFSALVAERYLRIIRDGSWFAPLRQALDAYVDKIQERVTGVIRLRLFKGDCTIVDCQLSAALAPTIIALAKA